MEDVFAIFRTCFGNSLIFQLFPRVMSPMNGKAGTVSTILVVCLALETIMKDQVEQLKKISVVTTATDIDEEAGKNQKV